VVRDVDGLTPLRVRDSRRCQLGSEIAAACARRTARGVGRSGDDALSGGTRSGHEAIHANAQGARAGHAGAVVRVVQFYGANAAHPQTGPTPWAARSSRGEEIVAS